MMYYRLKSFLEKENIFNDSQYGYAVRGRGTPCPCFAMARQQSGVYDMHIRQCKRQVQVTRKTRVAGVWD